MDYRKAYLLGRLTKSNRKNLLKRNLSLKSTKRSIVKDFHRLIQWCVIVRNDTPGCGCLSVAFVTGFGKTLHMGFFQKIEFDAWLISSSIELTRVEVLGQSRASLWRYSALFVIAPHPQ